MSESFVMYRSFHESLKELSREQYGNVMFALNEYALNGEEIELTGIEKAVFMLMKPQIDANMKRRENGRQGAEYGRKGGRPKKENPIGDIKSVEEKPLECKTETPNVNVNVNANGNENVNANGNAERGFSSENPPSPPEKTADPPKKPPHFTKPTLDEVASYCDERRNGIDARAFFDFYESKGWKIGSARMSDWRACVRTWERRRKTEQTGGRNKAGAMWGNENEVPQEIVDMF